MRCLTGRGRARDWMSGRGPRPCERRPPMPDVLRFLRRRLCEGDKGGSEWGPQVHIEARVSDNSRAERRFCGAREGFVVC